MIVLRFLALLGLAAAALHAAAPLPAPKAMPTAAMNLFPGGPAIPSAPPSESAHPAAIPLWPNGAPGFESRRDEPEHVSYRQEADIVFPVISNVHNPSLTPFLPEKTKATGAAVIIAPGGGNWFHTIDREGYDLARLLAARGIAAFVLKYRLARDLSNPPNQPAPYTAAHAFADAQRAIRVVRAHAAEWNVRRDRVGFLGFSAGGELALLVGVRNDAGQPGATDVVEREGSRPDFFAPIYPGGLEGRAGEVAKDKTPPAFLLCAYDDRPPEALADFFAALKRAGVPAELHIYGRGGHGFGVRADRPDLAISRWPDRFVEWLGDSGFLK